MADTSFQPACRPVLLLQHEPHLGSRRLQAWLQGHGLRHVLIHAALGGTVPTEARDFAAVVLLGSSHHAQEDLPWIHAEQRLAASALQHEVPVLGQGLGAQLLARAAGAEMLPRPGSCLGWNHAWLTQAARQHLGLPGPQVEVFDSHAHSLELPHGATRLMFDRRCLNKAFALGPHLGLMCHLEVDALALRQWCAQDAHSGTAAQGRDVQSGVELMRHAEERSARLGQFADRVYAHWIRGLSGPARIPIQELARG